jgi:hypoxanthine phosphoribosyltransferase
MRYITVNDLSNTIRENLWKIPRDIDFVIGIPRSGMIAASLISSYLNVPLIDINGFVSGVEPYGGMRLLYFNADHKTNTNKVLVVDDTVFQGNAMNATREMLKGFPQYQFIFSCVYLEKNADAVDIYLEDVRRDANWMHGICIYEWNIFQHKSDVTRNILYDIDGVFCLDPPDERNEERYLNYIANATPLFIPRAPIGGIVTYRLNKNREITEKWLKEQGIKYDKLFMFNANSWDERAAINPSPGKYKAECYGDFPQYKLFIESDEDQALQIASITHKPVLCVKTNRLYN